MCYLQLSKETIRPAVAEVGELETGAVYSPAETPQDQSYYSSRKWTDELGPKNLETIGINVK
jgi:hypothetical protein